ncbi:MAG: capsular biosynthesis protein [Lachnospiraceae bacterium]|jgi:capsular polysaccharide biosynthesis protein|nr:capsular biosynthesis protein [Lachnospiraceae bacterium]
MNENNRGNEIEIDIVVLFFEYLRHWPMILLSAVLAGTVGLLASLFLMTPQYQSTSELFVLSKSTSITSLADIQMGTSLTNDYMVIVNERPVLEQVIANLGIDETYLSLKEKVTLNNPTNSRILQIKVTDSDPERAKRITDGIAEVASAFIAEKMVQDPPTIISYGYTDGNPVSPNTTRNTIIGVLLGILLALAILTVQYLMNDTVENTEDVERKLGLNLLGTLPFEVSEQDLVTKDPRKERKKKKSQKKTSRSVQTRGEVRSKTSKPN